MSLKIDATLDQKLTRPVNIDLRNLVNFHQST